MSRISFDLLPEKNREALNSVIEALGSTARLAGGTALMLQIKHRQSYDLDFFLSKSLGISHLERKLMNTLGRNLRLSYASSDQMNLEYNDIRISLIHFPFLPLESPLLIKNINITTLRDIASEKVYTIGRREEWRDYVDLFAILRRGNISIDQIISDCKKRFGDAFSLRLILNQLSNASEVQLYSIDWLWKPIEPVEIYRFFTKIVKDLAT